MKRIQAQFRRRWRPGRAVLAMLSALVACTVAVIAGAVWQHHRVDVLRTQIAQLVEEQGAGARPLSSRPVPPYQTSAQQFLRERSAGWAPMLRTLENGAMVGVTPSSVEFDAADGVARVELNYSDSAALFDYLGRINEGVSPSPGIARWTLVETRVQSAGTPNANDAAIGMQSGVAVQSVASIRSIWLEPASANPSVDAAP